MPGVGERIIEALLRKESERMADVEFGSDLAPLLAKSPIARLGFAPKSVVPASLAHPSVQREFRDGDVLGSTTVWPRTFGGVSVNPAVTGETRKEVYNHEFGHRGMGEVRRQLYNSKDRPKFLGVSDDVDEAVVREQDWRNQGVLADMGGGSGSEVLKQYLDKFNLEALAALSRNEKRQLSLGRRLGEFMDKFGGPR